MQKGDREAQQESDKLFYLSIWRKRLPHKCAYCGKRLGSTPSNWMFDHILEKGKYEEFRYEENNIAYTCLICHDNKSRGFITSTMKEIIEQTKKSLLNDNE